MEQQSSGRRFKSIGLVVASVALCAAGCGDDTGGSTTSNTGGSGQCGGGEAISLTVEDVRPAVGAVVANDAIVHSFTVKDAPGLFQSFTFQLGAGHTAGTFEGGTLSLVATPSGDDVTYEADPTTWTTAPGTVELSVLENYEGPDGCIYKFDPPLFSYEVEAGMGGGGMGGGGMGGGG